MELPPSILAKATPYFGTRTLAADMYVVPATQYTTFIMGNGAISYEDIGAKVPYEMARDPKTKGGEDTLYMRQRKVFSPYGISYEKKSQTKLSPTDSDLENGQNWTLVTVAKLPLPSAPISTTRPFPLPGFSLWADEMAVIPVA